MFHSQLVWIAEAETEWLGHLGDLDVHHGPGRKSCYLFTILYTLNKIMQGIFILELGLPPVRERDMERRRERKGDM